MENKTIDNKELNLIEFINKNKDIYILIVTGSCYFTNEERNGNYNVLMVYNNHKKILHKDFENIKSSNLAMLEGIKDSISLIKKDNSLIYAIVPTELGFKRVKRGKGANLECVKDILQLCEDKTNKLNVIVLKNGAETIKHFINFIEKKSM